MRKILAKRILSAAAAASLLSTAAVANIAVDGTGQFAVTPAYFASTGFETGLKIVNTDTDSVMIYRVVVRDAACSQEVDFNIYLTPGDVWTAKIQNVGGKAYVFSSDDSNSIDSISSGNGLDLKGINTKAAGDFTRGYVEFYPVAEVDLVAGQESRSVGKIDKKYVAAVEKYLAGQAVVPAAVPADADTYGELAGKPISAPNNEGIAGFATLKNTSTDYASASTIPMLMFENVATDAVVGNAATATIDTNPASYLGAAGVAAVEAALQRSEVILPYSNASANNTAFALTFWNDGYCLNTQQRTFSANIRDEEERMYSAPEGENISGRPDAEVDTINLEVAYEYLNEKIVKNNYEQGWVSLYNLKNNTHTNQVHNGTPYVIPTQLSAEKVGDRWTLNWMYNPVK